MSLKIFGYSDFKKRKNSTLQPSANEKSTLIECVLKENTSYCEPVFIFAFSGKIEYRYLKWVEWYYFVTDIVSIGHNLWELHCELDPLATWKSDILETNAYAVYSSNNYNQFIIDDRLIQRTDTTRATGSTAEIADMVNLSTWAQGTYMLQLAGLANGTAPITGATQIYACTLSQARTVNEKLMKANDTIQEQLSRMFGGQLTNAIIGLRYIPIKVDTIPTNLVYPVAIANWDLGIGLGEPTVMVKNGRTKITFTRPYKDFRGSKCCRYFLYLPSCGLHELDSSIIQFNDIWVSYFIDLLSGTIMYIVSVKDSDVDGIIYTTAGNFSAPLSTTVYNDNKAGNLINLGLKGLDFIVNNQTSILLNSVTPMGVSVGTNPLGNIFSSTFGAPKELSGNGTTGGIGSLLVDRYITSYTEYVADSDIPSNMSSNLGRPCGRNLPISSCVGYVQTVGASVSTKAPSIYRDIINKYLDGGVFIE